MSDYHISVLLKESVDSLHVKQGGTYVDVTFGAGGHSRAILEKLSAKGHVYAFDQDEDAVGNAIQDDRFTLIEANFRYLKRFLRLEGVLEVDGILADLGVSSHQLDTPERGFSYRFDAPLDMRMNASMERTAADVLREADEQYLMEMFSQYGEVRNAKTLAAALVKFRKTADIRTTYAFNAMLDQHAIGPRQKYFSQVYQALRMEVNDEISALEEMLVEGTSILKPGGRFVVITFHSIEDRVVKNFFRYGTVSGEPEKDAFGNIQKVFAKEAKNVVMAGEDEQGRNVRSRSAKLRVAVKL
jgi:16S rRNA (cytosine1402-N4)-methyltransferase